MNSFVQGLRLQNIVLAYGDRTLLEIREWRPPAGHLSVVRGRSGTGKSTLLRVIAGLAPFAGSIEFDGVQLPQGARFADDVANWRKEQVGYLTQDSELLPELRGIENAMLPLRLQGVSKRMAQQQVTPLLDLLGIRDAATRFPAKMSGGERQRLALVQSLARGPKLLLVDEPTSSLDQENAQTVYDSLRAIANTGATVIVATHDPLFFNHRPQWGIEKQQLRVVA